MVTLFVIRAEAVGILLYTCYQMVTWEEWPQHIMHIIACNSLHVETQKINTFSCMRFSLSRYSSKTAA